MSTFASTTRTRENTGERLVAPGRSKCGPEYEHSPAVSSFPALLLHRKAACACGGGCPACQAKSGGLKISRPNDSEELEADRIADRVMRMPEDQTQAPIQNKPGISRTLSGSSAPVIQSKGDGGSAVTPALSNRINLSRGNGNSLDGDTLSFMQRRFGEDFSGVKVHADTEAVRMAHELRAKAFTVGEDIYFDEAKYRPNTVNGRALLAHELAHTLQQKQGGGLRIQKEGDEIEAELVEASYPEALELHNRGIDLPVVGTPPPVRQPQVLEGSAWSLNGRSANDTKRAPGFTGDTSGTYISHIDVYIFPSMYSIVDLTWANMGNSPGYVLPQYLIASPGAGNCSVDCGDITQSQQGGSHCTPISPPNFVVQGFSRRLGSYPTATFVTWFHYDRGVAFHYYDVPVYPASHGCVRLSHSDSGAEWIYDNSLPGITTVTVHRDASQGPGPMCWQRGRLIARPQPSAGP